MKIKLLLISLSFIFLQACTHFYSIEKKGDLSILVPENQKYCFFNVENNSISKETFQLEKDSEIVKKISESVKYFEYNCDNSSVQIYFWSNQKKSTPLFMIMSLGVIPMFLDTNFFVKVLYNKQIVYDYKDSGSLIVSPLFIPFFFFIKNKDELFENEILRYFNENEKLLDKEKKI